MRPRIYRPLTFIMGFAAVELRSVPATAAGYLQNYSYTLSHIISYTPMHPNIIRPPASICRHTGLFGRFDFALFFNYRQNIIAKVFGRSTQSGFSVKSNKSRHTGNFGGLFRMIGIRLNLQLPTESHECLSRQPSLVINIEGADDISRLLRLVRV